MQNKLNVLLIQPPLAESVDKEYLSVQIPLNLLYIASSLEKEGVNVKIVDFSVERFIKDKLLNLLSNFRPDIVGFTSMTPSIYSVREISKITKDFDKEILTMLGGIHISALPKRTLLELQDIDVGILGEGEITVKEICELKNSNKPIKNVKGTICHVGKKIKVNKPRELIKDLDDIPFPARHLLKMDNYAKSHVSRGFSRKYIKIAEIMTSRGCPNRCIFCASRINYGLSLRFRSYENIVNEIEHLIKKYHINHVSIEDDTFTINRKLLSRLCGYLRKRKLTWNCNGRVNTVDFELLKLMKKSGCKKICFGVEAGSPKILKLIKKNITLKQVRNAFKWARKAGIRYVECTFILGSHPDETMADINKTKKLIFELMPDFIAVSIITPFPGTEVYHIMNSRGLLEKDSDWSKFTFINNTPSFKRLTYLSSEALIKKQREILKKYYSSPRYMLSQLIKIRSIGEILYFFNLVVSFIGEFILKKKP